MCMHGGCGCVESYVYSKVHSGVSVDAGASWAPWGAHVVSCMCCRYYISGNTGQEDW